MLLDSVKSYQVIREITQEDSAVIVGLQVKGQMISLLSFVVLKKIRHQGLSTFAEERVPYKSLIV